MINILYVTNLLTSNRCEILLDNSDEHARPRMAAFLALRALIGTAIESFVVFDRLLYLHEQDTHHSHSYAQLRPIFDETLSPRNLILLANKPSA